MCLKLDWFPSHLVGFAFGPQQWWWWVIFKYPIVLDWFSGIKGASPFSNLTVQSMYQVLIFCAPHKFLVVDLCIIGPQRYHSLWGGHMKLAAYHGILDHSIMCKGSCVSKAWLIFQPFGWFCFWSTTVMILSDIQIYAMIVLDWIFGVKRCLTIL